MWSEKVKFLGLFLVVFWWDKVDVPVIARLHSTLPVRPQFIFPNSPDKIQFEVGVPLSVRSVRAHFQQKHNPIYEECGSYWESDWV